MKAFPLTALLIFSVGLGVWWLESRFGSEAALFGLILLFVVGGIVLGWLLSLASGRQSLGAVTQFNQADALTDRYRQQTTQYLLEGDQLGQRVQLLQERRLNRQQLVDQQRFRAEMDQRRALSYTGGEEWGNDGSAWSAQRVFGQPDEGYREFD